VRNLYLTALCQGRKNSALEAPNPLAWLLLDTAIFFYRDTLKTYVNRPFDKLLFCKTIEELETLISTENEENKTKIRVAFTNLEEGIFIYVPIQNDIYCVMKDFGIILDEL